MTAASLGPKVARSQQVSEFKSDGGSLTAQLAALQGRREAAATRSTEAALPLTEAPVFLAAGAPALPSILRLDMAKRRNEEKIKGGRSRTESDGWLMHSTARVSSLSFPPFQTISRMVSLCNHCDNAPARQPRASEQKARDGGRTFVLRRGGRIDIGRWRIGVTNCLVKSAADEL